MVRMHSVGLFNRISRSLILALFLIGIAHAADPAKLARTDIRISYLFQDERRIDWPLVFYLNDDLGYRVDLVQVQLKAHYALSHVYRPDEQLNLHRLALPAIAPAYFDSAWGQLFPDRYPDILIVGEPTGNLLFEAFINHLTKLPKDTARVFNVSQIFRVAESGEIDLMSAQVVAFNRQELETKYRDDMRVRIPDLFPGTSLDSYTWDRLGRYELIAGGTPATEGLPIFAAGTPKLRLEEIFANRLPKGPIQDSYLKRAASYARYLDLASINEGREQVRMILNAYKDLLYISKERSVLASLESAPDFRAYMDDLLNRAQRMALHAVGLRWDGEIILRPSPEGPKLKFRAAISANGPQAIELGSILFYPYWKDSSVSLDSMPHMISPHNSFVREYLVDIPRSRLESAQQDSLLFTTSITYDGIDLELHNALPVVQKPEINVAFMPDYLFMPQVSRSEADKMIHPLSLLVRITKPQSLTGTAGLALETPAGMFAGAYKQMIQLDKGTTAEFVRIPFSVSNLFELGINRASVALTLDGKLVDSDTARLRIAECNVPATRKIAFLPDTSGMLEDVLRMVNAPTVPLTDRGLLTMELASSDVLVIGSGAFKNNPSFNQAKDRIEEFLTGGGSVVLFGQPIDFPDGVLPASISTAVSLLDRDEITNRIPDAKLLKSPYPITEKDLFSSFYRRQEVMTAVISPAEVIYAGPKGEALLSVSRFGKGQIIYCGLPLLEMIGGLQIDAIHLLANILNY